MKNNLIYILLIFFSVISCKKEKDINNPAKETDANGVVVSLPYNWKKSLHATGFFSSNGTLGEPIYYNGNIGIPTTNGNNKKYLTLINPDNGASLWNWDDRYQPATKWIGIDFPYQHNNLLTYQVGTRSYCINLDNGTTHWKIRRSSPFAVRLYGGKTGEYFATSPITNINGNIEYVAFRGNIETSLLTEYLTANFSNNYVSPKGVGFMNYVYSLPNNANLLLVSYAEPLPNWKLNTFLGLYNRQTNTWVYERKLMAPPTQNSSIYWPQIYNGKLYASVGWNLVCHDIMTGEQIWRQNFSQDFLFSGFIIAEDKIIANNEDTYTYCLDPKNGNILWKEPSAGTSGRASYLNGIVYFVGGSSGKLHAIEVSTGKTVWRIDAGKIGDDPSQDYPLFKTNAVYVFPAKNGKPAKVIALSHLYAYSFNAYR